MHPASIAPPADDPLRARLHGLWSAVSGGWDAHADYVDERASEHAGAMLDAAALRPGARVLELACGPGGLGLAAARCVGARRRGRPLRRGARDGRDRRPAGRGGGAPQRRRERSSTSSGSTSRTPSYDVVLCREGLMFVPDPAAAAAEIAACCVPAGGRRSRCGRRASATRGSASSSTR